MYGKRILVGSGVAGLLIIGAVVGSITFGSVFAASPHDSGGGGQTVSMSGADAEAIALAAYPGATVVESDLDNENGVWAFQIALDNGLQVIVDPGTGAILDAQPVDPNVEQDVADSGDGVADGQPDGDAIEEEVVDNGTQVDESEGEDPAVASGQAVLTAADAEAIALEAYPGTKVIASDLENDHGVLVYSVGLDNGSDVQVDATTGSILATDSGDMDQQDEED